MVAETVIYLLSFVAVLSTVIFVHEFGHFQVARTLRVRAEAFAIGFGKEILGRTDKQGTRWKIGMIPLGGYVKFAEQGKDQPPLLHEFFFQSAPLWRRALVVLAGPVANFIFSCFVFACIFAVDGRNVRAPVVAGVEQGSPAERAGFQIGDRIVRVAGKPVDSFDDLRRFVFRNPGETYSVDVKRMDEILVLSVSPVTAEMQNEFGGKQAGGRLGLQAVSTTERLRYNPVEALYQGARFTGFIVTETVHYITSIFKGQASGEHFGGPLSIGKASGDTAKMAFEAGDAGLAVKVGQALLALLTLAAVLSVSVGLFNLLPIPLLDGGHLVFYAMEAVSGREPSEKVREFGYRIGLTAIMCLMVFAFWNDLGNLGLFKVLGGLFS